MGASSEGGSPATKILLSAASAAAAESVTFPIDVLKTRLQLLSQPLPARHVASSLLRDGAAVYRGLPPAVLRHVIYTPLRVLAYERLRAVAPPDSAASRALAGGLSGVLAQVAASPADLVKVRMQADPRRYSGGFADALRMIVKEEGVRGLWRGAVPNAKRAFLVNMGELATYDRAKHRIIDGGLCREGVAAHSLASLASGLCSAALSCPADVVKTRMMNKNAAGGYASSWSCLAETVRGEGLRALWKGFLPTWGRLGPWQFVFWVSYEQLRRAAGLSPF